jgi:hypothetical protein
MCYVLYIVTLVYRIYHKLTCIFYGHLLKVVIFSAPFVIIIDRYYCLYPDSTKDI